MLTLVLSALAGAGVGLGLYFGDALGYGWSTFCGVLTFVVLNSVAGYLIQKKVKAAMARVQSIMLAGQKRVQAKMARWQVRPPGSVQAAQAEMAKDQKAIVLEALAETEPLHRFDLWVPLMKRQIATAQFQLHWMIKDFKKVDELMPKVLFVDPTMSAMKIARMYMLGKPSAEIGKVYEKAVRRLRYNQNVLLAAVYTWILVRRNEIDAAFKALNRALEKSDNATLKANRENLANNRVAHFTNTALGDQWYALLLEEPKVHQPRQRMQWR
ncbi:MAG: hypothetical protein ACI4RA_01785 [Kiritimatiellia bacterium]